jgi:hypothetical protein
MARDFLTAYLRTQEAHKAVHRLTRAFEAGATDDEIRRLATEARAAIAEVHQLISKVTGD